MGYYDGRGLSFLQDAYFSKDAYDDSMNWAAPFVTGLRLNFFQKI